MFSKNKQQNKQTNKKKTITKNNAVDDPWSMGFVHLHWGIIQVLGDYFLIQSY